jgi:excisionase family DNA binding protein
MTTEPWVSIEGVAKHPGVAKYSVCRWIDTRSLPAHKSGRLWKFELTELDEWVCAGGLDAHDQDDKGGAR